jgi:phenylpropionate dioxygenase-like ring-hydroxylating dioxygenase large terminal subunit
LADDRFDTSEFRIPRPGDARCPGPSTRDLILADGQQNPSALVEERYAFLGDADIDYDRYISQDFFDLEMKKLWPKVWQWACREEHLLHVGDYLTYDIGPYSVILVRSAPDEIKGYVNACLHRGTQFRPSDSRGVAPILRCPFHGWSWSLDGQVKDIPCRWDFPHVTDEAFRLPEVKVERWGGFVFINLDPDAGPLADHLGVLPEHFKDGWDLSNRYTVLHIQKELDTNWKAAQEAFLEAYHVFATHTQGLPTAGDANAQYDIFGDTVTRFVHTIGHPSPHYTRPQTQQEILDKLRSAPEGVVVPEGRLARSVASEQFRKTLSAAWGVDLSGYSDSEMIDSIEYHLFPNMFMFPGVTLPMIYRFRPIGMDVGRTLFDLLFLQPLAPGQERPEAPAPHRLSPGESYASAPGMSQGLGFVYDQDTDNLAMQYKGFQASRKRGQTLGNYQEARTRRVHLTLDAWLKA